MKRILIADDNATVRRGLRGLIARNDDWQVCGEANDGREAVQRTRELHPDVLVLDLATPGMNGIRRANWRRSSREYKSCYVPFRSQLTWLRKPKRWEFRGRCRSRKFRRLRKELRRC